MKKLIAALLAILCLVGCSAKKEQAQTDGVSQATKNETVEAPVEEKPVENFEIEIEEPVQEAPAESGSSVSPAVEMVEGLVGDAVGYAFEKPVFVEYGGAETMNAFYVRLVEGLVAYAEGNVNETCMQNNCVASVYGTVVEAVLVGEELKVTYECRVEYSGDVEGTVNVRVDTWNVKTGEVNAKAG